MSWAHLHLALNHVPVIGLPIVLLLLAWALVRRSPELTKASFGLLVLLAIVTIIVQLTGEPAEELVEGLPGVLESAVERHEEAAVLGTIGIVAIGVIALIGLWRLRAGRMLARWYPSAVFVAGVMVAGMMGWIANLGGQIRHSEIRTGPDATLDGGPSSLRQSGTGLRVMTEPHLLANYSPHGWGTLCPRHFLPRPRPIVSAPTGKPTAGPIPS